MGSWICRFQYIQKSETELNLTLICMRGRGPISYFQTQTGLFPISGQSLINENYHNSRTSDIDMKLGPVPKRYNRNKTTSKKVDDDVMSTNYDVIVIFPIYGQFGAIRKPDSGRIVCKTYIFITSNLLSYKN